MNGMSTTGTVHAAHDDNYRGVAYLMQDCGTSRHQKAALTATDLPVTCKRCLTLRKATPAKAAPVARTSSGPVTWGIFDAQGAMVTFRTTKREATTAADRIGGTAHKI